MDCNWLRLHTKVSKFFSAVSIELSSLKMFQYEVALEEKNRILSLLFLVVIIRTEIFELGR